MDGGGAAPLYAAPNAIAPAAAGVRVENCYVFKSRLQEYAQKAGLPTPEYRTLKEGPSHEPIFRSAVLINATWYDSLPGFFSRKAAEQSAAEVALMEIVKSVPPNGTIPAVQETGLCKNLLQEYAQKMNYAIPSYICTKQTSGLAPFICTVEIGGIQYIGAAARTKKEAEIKAARTALLAIQGRSEGCANGSTKYIVVPGQRQVKETDKKPIETPKPLKVRKGGYKKKWNKKFMRKTDHTVDAENNGATVAGDVHYSDVPMQVTVNGVPSSDITIQQPDDGTIGIEQDLRDATMQLQPDEEAGVLNQDPPIETAILIHDEKARRPEQEPCRDTATVEASEEALTVKLEPPNDTATRQTGDDARIAELEPSTVVITVQPNERARTTKQEPLNIAQMLKPNEEGQEILSTCVVLQSDGVATHVKEEVSSSTAMLQCKAETRTVLQETASDAEFVQPNWESMFENSKPAYE